MTSLLSRRKITDLVMSCLQPDQECAALVDRLRRVQIAGARHGRAGYYPDGDWCYGIGAEIRALEEILDLYSGEVHDLYAEAHSSFFRDGTINPGERDWKPDVYIVVFGVAMLTTPHEVRVHACGAEDALETAADYAYDRWPGLFESEDDMADANGEDELADRIANRAECDLTPLDGGRYIRSDNWTIDGPI